MMRAKTLGLETLADSAGSVTFGWMGTDVLYARTRGVLSAEVGVDFARRLGMVVPLVRGVKFFYDSADLKGYDLLARSAFFRAVMANRQHFSSITFLSWTEGISPAAQTFVDAIGEGAQIFGDRAAFEAQLFAAAPQARGQLDAARLAKAPQTKVL